MLFSKYAAASLLVLTSAVLSQVVVTVTDTVTVITVTVAPQTTSTSTQYVTIIGGSPPTSTRKTVTYTETTTLNSVPSSDNCVVKYLGQCDGDAFNGCGNCDNGLVCTYYTHYYSQCLKPGQKVHPISKVVETATVYI